MRVPERGSEGDRGASGQPHEALNHEPECLVYQCRLRGVCGAQLCCLQEGTALGPGPRAGGMPSLQRRGVPEGAAQ